MENALQLEKQSKADLQTCENKLASAEKELRNALQQNSDLSRQVQHLLQVQLDRSVGLKTTPVTPRLQLQTPVRQITASGGSGGGFTPRTPVSSGGSPQFTQRLGGHAHDVVSDNLVVVSDVAEMQRNNMYLVATVRSLTDELEKALVKNCEMSTATNQSSNAESESLKKQVFRLIYFCFSSYEHLFLSLKEEELLNLDVFNFGCLLRLRRCATSVCYKKKCLKPL